MIAINLPSEDPRPKGNGGADPRPNASSPPPGDTQSSRRRSRVRPQRATALYVAQDLRSWETNEPDLYDREIAIDDFPYRRLDPEFYVWLKFVLDWAMDAYNSGRIDAALLEKFSRRFSAVHVWAKARFGVDALRRAEDEFDAQEYSPPPASTRSKRFPRRSRQAGVPHA